MKYIKATIKAITTEGKAKTYHFLISAVSCVDAEMTAGKILEERQGEMQLQEFRVSEVKEQPRIASVQYDCSNTEEGGKFWKVDAKIETLESKAVSESVVVQCRFALDAINQSGYTLEDVVGVSIFNIEDVIV